MKRVASWRGDKSGLSSAISTTEALTSSGIRFQAPTKSQELQEKRGFPSRREREANAGKSDLCEQHKTQNSCFVPVVEAGVIVDPPKYLWKVARAIWTEVWATAKGESIQRQRRTDAAVVARYCALRAQLEAMMGKAPEPTYNTTSTAGSSVIKANPAWAAMMQFQQQVTSLEHLLGLTPRSRIDLLQRYADHRDPMKSTSPMFQPEDFDPNAPSKPASPFGLLAFRPRDPGDRH